MTWLHDRRWEPVTAPITNGSDHRSAPALETVLAQFDLAHARYVATATDTFCTTLGWDVTRALGCEVPHYWLAGDRVIEQDANAIANWFALYGALRHGWLPVDMVNAIAGVNAGMPVCGIAKNPSGHGHMVIGRPTPPGSELLCKMAGRINADSIQLSKAFGGLHPMLYRHA